VQAPERQVSVSLDGSDAGESTDPAEPSGPSAEPGEGAPG
jgi:hypothetical protein